jgi:hypothetical protein
MNISKGKPTPQEKIESAAVDRQEWKTKKGKKSKWYNAYENAVQRCTNKKLPNYKNYGGRGIKMVASAKDFLRVWLREKGYLMTQPSIDRINNDGNYTLKNLRFIDCTENRIKDQWIVDEFQDYKSGHRGRINRYTWRQIKKGICTRCTKPSVTKYYCKAHQLKSTINANNRRNKKRLIGECLNCKEKAITKNFCHAHRLIDLAKQKRLRLKKLGIYSLNISGKHANV